MFQSVSNNVQFPRLEEEVLAFWKAGRIYEKSLTQRAGAPRFVFYEGPPTANGMPHPGHCLTRAIKDLFPRYRTMRGYLCERKAGWDTHGLPVEVEVCKELGIHAKEEIEAYGVEPFIHKCQESVWRYMREWERLTERLGFWIHLDEAYVTYHQSYVESVWWSLKNLFDRGLLYQGHKIVWWWAQGGTALSAGEVGQGYREVADPSVYVRFPLLDESGKVTDTSLLVWTTTPWTLASNQFAAVHPDLEYVEVDFFRDGDGPSAKSRSMSGAGSKSHSWSHSESGAYRRSLHGNEERTRVIVAKALLATLAEKFNLVAYQIKREMKGNDLVGSCYKPPFDYYYKTLGPVKGVRMMRGFGDGTGPNRNSPEVRKELDAAIHRLTMRGGGIGFDPLYYQFQFVPVAWRLVEADFVTTDSGTGIVHIAPAFGEDDHELLKSEQANFIDPQPELINAVAPDGKFTAEAPDYQGRWVKDCDKDITRNLRERGLLYHFEQYVHDYPFCWRAEEDPLIQYPRRSWFIKTTEFKDCMLANNERINWLPDHIKHGRFGNFLESNVDWALSRERFWGTPLPIWVCEESGEMEAVGCYAELLRKPGVKGTEVWEAAKKANPKLVDDLKVHKPYIDAVTYDSPFSKGSRMKRVTEVIDCWYDSGAMPFAQWGYPHQGCEKFAEQFPADFISEALDQTRGWFYSQLAISTLLFSKDDSPQNSNLKSEIPNRKSQIPNPEFPHPFRNCIVLGLMLGEDGQKMSKSKRNYREPGEIFDKYGADALRWFFFANQPPWTTIRYSERAIKESIPEFLLRLWNVYSFFVIYANIDGFAPEERLGGQAGELTSERLAGAKGYRPVSQRSELDRWVLSELNRTAAAVVERMDAYDNYAACTRLTEFVDALSNWYVRRSRDRFWSDDKESPDKLDAYWTLYECLVTTSKLIAPFTPFLAESLWRNLAGVFGPRAAESVHLCDYPTGAPAVVDGLLSEQMKLLREIASLGRAARMEAKLKVRQPLAKVEVILADPAHQPWLEAHDALLSEELNVKQVEYTKDAQKYISYQVQPNFKRLGPRVGKLMPGVKAAVAAADAGAMLAELTATNKVTLNVSGETVELDSDDIQVRLQAKPGWAAAQGKACVVVLSTELTPELLREGIAKDVVRLIQDRRKELDCRYTDRIEVGIVTDSADVRAATGGHTDFICKETLAMRLVLEPLEGAPGIEHEIGDGRIVLFVRIAK